ncbi:exported protein of unknown function [Candidatus Filomicrobium marinum]|uniref:Uncharacterized protein n=2 Tax=Filomicrobium TaxID=119044 RepID=A0A0D6JGZ7_9HYPH|nr:exported protein of unknown function [Candidatus Filomicrobium marinum]CPR20598.1 exported protein of unknown function [Candidatus Filomicrobium marinum]SDP16426.1 hypothetical protein SAMN04488061_2368 [Filomicrobium insigne]
MRRILTSLVVALALAAGVSAAQADPITVHGYLGTNYGGK